MNALRKSLLAGSIGVLAGIAMASTAAPPQSQTRDIAMVVHVDKQGKVTHIQPARRMPPWEHDMLMQKLGQWITRPATDKHGKPMSSRFIMQVAMTTSQQANGNYNAAFKVIKTMPIGFAGPVHWNDVDHGRELYLVSDMSGSSPQQIPIPPPTNVPANNLPHAAPPPPPPPPKSSSGGGYL